MATKIPPPTDNVSLEETSLKEQVLIGRGKPLESTTVSDYHVVDALFRRELLMEHHIRFHTDLYLHEDDVFMAECYAVSERVVATQLPLYRYVVKSSYSHTHNTTPERARKIIDSALLAVQYRHEATHKLNNPSVDALEQIKVMRFVYSCSNNMLNEGYPYRDYRDMLNRFRPYGCYPLKIKWVDICIGVSAKLKVKTLLCNHPLLAHLLLSRKR